MTPNLVNIEDYPTYLSKQEAMERTGFNKKKIERLVKSEDLVPLYVKGRTGPAPIFNPADIDALIAGSAKDATIDISESSPVTRMPAKRGNGHSGTMNNQMLEVIAAAAQPNQQMLELLGAAIRQNQQPLVPITQKAGLTLEEAIAISGMSGSALMKGVKAGKIVHDKRGERGSIRLSRESVEKFASQF